MVFYAAVSLGDNLLRDGNGLWERRLRRADDGNGGEFDCQESDES